MAWSRLTAKPAPRLTATLLLALVNDTAGVKDVVNDIKVAPVSGFDDEIRICALRAIYHDPALGQYAIDPAGGRSAS